MVSKALFFGPRDEDFIIIIIITKSQNTAVSMGLGFFLDNISNVVCFPECQCVYFKQESNHFSKRQIFIYIDTPLSKVLTKITPIF